MGKRRQKRPPDPSPWQEGTDVRGIVPPGRRLSPPEEPRPTPWSASGVAGVVPPGNASVRSSPSADWAQQDERDKAKTQHQNQQALRARQRGEKEPKAAPTRPTAGVMPDPFADTMDPDTLGGFIKVLHGFVQRHPTQDAAHEDLAARIIQSHAPFEIVVAFAVLSLAASRDPHLRNEFAMALERGAKVFFNLVERLGEEPAVPAGMKTRTVDALFYSLPGTALQLPFAFATDAFWQLSELLREPANTELDAALLRFNQELRANYIEGRSFGDQALEKMFAWELPIWAQDLPDKE